MSAPPLVLLGETRSKAMLATLAQKGWGRMFVARRPSPYCGEPWGFDNGAFACWLQGRPLDEVEFERRLAQAQGIKGTPYLAVTPDIVAGGLHSLDYSLKWLDRLPPRWPWYLAVQDGMQIGDVEPVVERFAGLFLGGTDRFKGTAYHWRRLAHAHDRRFHYGRASTPSKLLSAYRVGSDSCDTAFPLWTAERMVQFTRFWDHLDLQGQLEGML